MFGGITIAILVGRAIALVIGFTIHEYAHAWTAYRLGDTSQLFRGRLTFDPRSHIEPVGIVLALLVGFGWAKPVAVEGSRFYPNERRSMMIVALAGPISNLILAIFFGIILRLLLAGTDTRTGLTDFGLDVLATIVLFNLVLMLFNLIPLSPLDGWKIMIGLLSPQQAYGVMQYERESMLALLLLLMMGAFSPAFNILGTVFGPLIDLFFNVVVG